MLLSGQANNRRAPPSLLVQIPNGAQGTRATLHAMRAIVRQAKTHPPIQEFAIAIIRWCSAKDWLCEVRAVHSWVRDNIRYTRDVTDIETIRVPELTLRLMVGDCDDCCVLAASALEAVGHPTRFAAVMLPGNREYSHVYLETLVGADWVGMELTEPWPLGRVPPGRRMLVHN